MIDIRIDNRLARALFVALVGAALIVGAWNLPLGKEERKIVRHQKAPFILKIDKGQTFRQGFLGIQGSQSAVVLHAPIVTMEDRQVVFRVLTPEGEELAVGDAVSESYDEDLLRMELQHSWLELSHAQQLVFELELVAGESLPLRVSDGDEYSGGQIELDGVEIDRDVALATMHPVAMFWPARMGLLAGVIFLFGLLLIVDWVPRVGRWFHQWTVAAVLLTLVTPLALLGFWYSDGELGISDWDYYFSLHEVYRKTIVDYGQVPLWNPYTCGGTAALGDPEFPLLTVTFLSELLFGIPAGVRIAAWISVLVTAWGLLALAKRLDMSVVSGLGVALVGAFSSVSILEIVEGHVNVFAAMWIPWIFWSWLGAYRENVTTFWPTRKSLLLSLFLTLTFYAGGIYLLMYTLGAFLFIPLLVKHPWRAILTTVRAGVPALGFAALKMVPVLLWLKQFPDDAYASSAYTLPWLRDVLLERHLHGSYEVWAQGSGWHEYGAYIGWIAFGLALIGLSWWRDSRIVRGLLVATIIVTLISAMGPALRPYFDQMPFLPRSSISRIILFSIIAIAFLVGYGLERLQQWKHGRVFAFLLVAFLAVDLFSLSYQLSEQSFVLPRVLPHELPEPANIIEHTAHTYDYRSPGIRQTRAYEALLRGYGVSAYCSVLGPDPLVRTIHDEGANEVFYVKEDVASYEVVYWTPNKARVKVVTRGDTPVILNTNHVKGWKVNGEEAISIDGRVGVKVGAGEHDLEFVYSVPGVKTGALITALSLIAVVIYLRRSKKQ